MPAHTILLADDDQDFRDLIQEVLEAEGYDVIPARTGKQAIEYLSVTSHLPPDLVILDLMMPLVTGWQVLKTIEHDPNLARVPVIVLTATSQDRPTGVAAFLRKPLELDVLLDTLHTLVPRKS